MTHRSRLIVLALLLIPAISSDAAEPVAVTKSVTFARGGVNAARIENDGVALAVYGWSRSKGVEQVLLTHGRRDVVWLAQPLIEAGVRATAPARDTYWLSEPNAFWKGFVKSRYHDYAQQTTKILPAPIKVHRWVSDGDTIDWRGLKFQVLETPGYTRGAVSYLVDVDGKRIAFTGDLIYGDGKVLDLYSFQDAIPEAQVRGYHGYGSRLAALVTSLKKLAAEKPDLLVPSRGPLIEKPQQAIDKLISRVRAVYRNYLSTNALHWYFKEKRMRQCGERVLGKDAKIDLMPYSRHEKTPNWVFENSTSRLLISDTGHGFLLDCGYQRVIDAISDLIKKGVVKKVDGIFVTHYHDDHTDQVQKASEVFDCPIYATTEYKDVLEHPEAYHLPAMTANPMKNVRAMRSGTSMKWREFDLQFHFFPGQTYYHGALLARKPGEKPIFFIGDAFAPSGLDDYCVLNRNLLHDDSGYLLCLKKLRAVKEEEFWLVNEHIQHVFSFNKKEMDYLESSYRARIKTLSELFPWDDPNYGVDEQWSFFHPYGPTAERGKPVQLEVRITNHSPVRRTFEIAPRGHGARIVQHRSKLTLGPRESGSLPVRVVADKPGVHLVTTDVRSEGMDFRQWVEAMVVVE